MSLWWRFRSGGRLWSVERGSPSEYPELAKDGSVPVRAAHLYRDTGDFGAVTLLAERRVVINIEDEGDEDEGVLHEMMHVAADAVPEDKRTWTYADEERFIDAVARKLWPILKARGLRWPSRRRGGSR